MKQRILCTVLACLLAAPAPFYLAAQPQDAANPNVEEITIPEGTEFKLQLHTTINSKTSRPGDRVLTTLFDPVAVEDQDVLSKGVRVDGHIGEVKPARRRSKGGYLTVVFDVIELPGGAKIAIIGSLTEVFASATGKSARVGPEGELKGGGASRKEQGAILAGATAAGVAGGAMGPAVAAGVGGLVAAIILPRGKEASLSAGSVIGMRLDRDVTLTLPQSSR